MAKTSGLQKLVRFLKQTTKSVVKGSGKTPRGGKRAAQKSGLAKPATVRAYRRKNK